MISLPVIYLNIFGQKSNIRTIYWLKMTYKYLLWLWLTKCLGNIQIFFAMPCYLEYLVPVSYFKSKRFIDLKKKLSIMDEIFMAKRGRI